MTTREEAMAALRAHRENVPDKPENKLVGGKRRVRSKQIQFWVRPSHGDMLKLAASRSGMTVSDYVRSCVMENVQSDLSVGIVGEF